ncbi:uncharacterized protein LOC125531412 [Triticum urartu]|uniref:uncharacterized protein LOC125531412 n=1 Tax=Triticum urartu TaxID=4572 RepID=UPI002043E552|nr:uncharacterized protein LOC125531412 [Triticum urartu]
MAPPNRRGGSGPKKTGIGRIEQEDARYVCYSKRRVGFFTKATDLSVLTGAQVAALAFSPRCRAISFGHPSVDSVVERFLAGEAAGAGARKEDAADDRLLAGEGAITVMACPRDKDMATFFAALMQEQGFEAAMDMQQMVMAALPPSQVVAAGMDMQETPPPPGLAAGMDMEQMQMTMPKPPGFDAGLDM